jgi:hypothetical protein
LSKWFQATSPLGSTSNSSEGSLILVHQTGTPFASKIAT